MIVIVIVLVLVIAIVINIVIVLVLVIAIVINIAIVIVIVISKQASKQAIKQTNIIRSRVRPSPPRTAWLATVGIVRVLSHAMLRRGRREVGEAGEIKPTNKHIL